MNVRDEIVRIREERIEKEGPSLGIEVPGERAAPLVPFLRQPGIICEIKRRSPSRGAIDTSLDPLELAGEYASRGVLSVSVLTEENHFAGSLSDLMRVKAQLPELAVLRKDFLTSLEDIDVSYRAGADAVLLIASILSESMLATMHERATSLGMAALVELHDDEDFTKALTPRPPLVGINARDLTDFSVDLLTPIRLRSRISWPHQAVFESGAFHHEDGLMVSQAGFSGLLVGEAAVRDQGAIPGLIAGLEGTAVDASTPTTPDGRFWRAIGRKLDRINGSRPLAKVCGITNRADAEAAVAGGADLLGFVFADSPRRANADVVRSCADLDVLRVAVVVAGTAPGTDEMRGLPEDVAALIRDGSLDAVQFHGDEEPDECAAMAFPYYKALRLASPDAASAMDDYRSPRRLVDARSSAAYGGTGERVDDATVAAVSDRGPLWLAGGLTDENIGEAITRYQPELVDASSGLESAPGKKDPEKLRRFLSVVMARE